MKSVFCKQLHTPKQVTTIQYICPTGSQSLIHVILG